MKVVACYSNKGGVGKTATAVNIAYWAANTGHRTLLIDLDVQGASSFYFRVKAKSSKNWKKRLLHFYEELAEQIRETDYPNLSIIPAHESFRDFDAFIHTLKKRKKRLKWALRGLKSEYDLIILDCPPSISFLAENIFNASDIVLVPVIPTTLGQRAFEQLVKAFKDLKIDSGKIFPFFSLVDSRKRMHQTCAFTLKSQCSNFLNQPIPYSADVEKMGEHRAPLDRFARSSRANRAFFALWREVEALIKGKNRKK